MLLRGIIFLLLLGTIWSCGRRMPPPNILLISLDTCRADHLSGYGYNRPTSPFLDELANRGVLFANAFVNTHGTPPSHTTIFSSLYQEVHRVNYRTIGVEELEAEGVPEGVVMIQEILQEHGYTTLGVTDGSYMGSHLGFGRGFDIFDDQGGGVESGTRRLVELIQEHRRAGGPIFAFYHTYEIHSPYLPPEEYRNIFEDFTSDFVPTSENLLAIEDKSSELEKEDLEYVEAMYDAGVRYTDDILRRLFGTLQDLGFMDNSLIIITSDHGEEFGEHGGLLHRALLYDELLHVPLVIVGNAVPAGKVDTRMVSSIDIAPTLLEYVGIPIPEMWEGRNLLTDGTSWPGSVISQYGDSRYSIRTTDWKFIYEVEPDRVELYDLRSDPKELQDLAHEKTDEVRKFLSQLAIWREEQRKKVAEDAPKIQLSKEELDKLRSLGYLR